MIQYNQLVQDVIDGVEDPLKAYGVMKTAHSHLSDCLVQIKELVMEQAELQGEKNFDLHGYSFERKNGRKILFSL